MVSAAGALLSASADGDISTRAVCDAVGVGQPVLYRLFGDKTGLLTALVDDGFDRYIARKQALATTADPVTDLRAGWDDHTEFALENPALYRLMFSPVLPRIPASAEGIFSLLKRTLDRCLAVGALAVSSDEAAQTILSANVGVCLSVISQPERYSDPGLSHRVRDAVFGACLSTSGLDERPPAEATTPDPLVRASAQLEAALVHHPPGNLENEEAALLAKWLRRLQEA